MLSTRKQSYSAISITARNLLYYKNITTQNTRYWHYNTRVENAGRPIYIINKNYLRPDFVLNCIVSIRVQFI